MLLVVAAMSALVLPAGCNKSDQSSVPTVSVKPTDDSESPKPSHANPDTHADKASNSASDSSSHDVAVKPTPDRPSPRPIPLSGSAGPAIMPVVQLSHGHQETCRVKVGDAMPAIELSDLDGKAQPLTGLLGEKLTVVLFWTSQDPYALQELADLGPDVVAPYGPHGVNVVAVNVRDEPDAARQAATAAQASFPILADSQGTALEQVASKKLPRTYLLDAAGKILWFDIEYSRSTRRELSQAIRSALVGK